MKDVNINIKYKINHFFIFIFTSFNVFFGTFDTFVIIY